MRLEDMNRVEVAISAIDNGNLEWDSWAHSNVLALGLAAIRNPLGDALTHYLDHAGQHEAVRVVSLVSIGLIKGGVPPAEAKKTAWDAFALWNDSHCHTCGGRGVLNFQQDPCPTCRGTGDADHGNVSRPVKDGIRMLDSALHWMEGQLRAKMRAH